MPHASRHDAPRHAAYLVASLVLALSGCGSRDGEPPPALETREAEIVYVVRDNGVQCVTHPCFNVEVLDPDGRTEIVSGVDLSGLDLTSAQRDSAQAAIGTTGLRATGEFASAPNAGPAGDGRVFRVRRLAP